MAPVKVCNELTKKDKIKLRKPLVEKMRRERINSSIEQLKALLQKELQTQQPCSKLEKADILETAVLYLKDNMRTAAAGGSAQNHGFADGFARCLEETLSFLCAHNQPAESRQKVANHFSRVPPPHSGRPAMCQSRLARPRISAPKCVSAVGRQPLWRPW